MLTVILHQMLPAMADAAALPEWLHLVPAGAFKGADGRGPYAVDDAGELIARSMATGKIAVDECHSTDLAAPKGFPAPARGWIVAMEARADGIWGRVEWNASGRALMQDRAYRGISPALLVSKGSAHILRVLRASLTNDPNLPLASLHSKDVDMDFLARLRTRLGLAADASEDAVFAAIETHAALGEKLRKALKLGTDVDGAAVLAAVETHARAADDRGQAIRQISTTLGVTHEGEISSEFLTGLHAKIKDGLSSGGDATLRATVVDLQSKLDRMSADRAREAAERFVDAALADGKPIRPLRDHYIARHQKDPEGVEKELNALASVNAGGLRSTPTRDPQSPLAGLGDEDLRICELMGVSPEDFAKTRKLEKEML